MKRSISKVAIFLILALFANTCAHERAEAEQLGELEFLYRCYSHLTQLYPLQADPIVAAVTNGVASAAQACEFILSLGTLTAAGNTMIGSPGDFTSTSLLNTFRQLHSSWLLTNQFPSVSGFAQDLGVRSYYNPSDSALYITKALFDPNAEATDIVTSNENLRAVRAIDPPPNGPISNSHTPDQFMFRANTLFTPQGLFLGVRATGVQTLAYSYFNNNASQQYTGSLDLTPHFGGGFLGSHAYLLTTLAEEHDFKADLGTQMPRSWAKNVVHDALCRDLPLVRSEDTVPYVVPTSEIPFRQSQGCVGCHATTDQMASILNRVTYDVHYAFDNLGEQMFGGWFIDFHDTTLPATSGWPASVDNNYHQRASNGRLYFRNYLGQLVNIPVTTLAGLGNAIAAQDDFFICLAKRYYKYFLGIDVYIGDPGSPLAPILNQIEQHHKDQVVSLGLRLKNSNNLATLIREILALPDYRERNYNTIVEE